MILRDVWGQVKQGNTDVASIWPTLTGHSLLEPSCCVVRKSRLHGEDTCRCSSQQPQAKFHPKASVNHHACEWMRLQMIPALSQRATPADAAWKREELSLPRSARDQIFEQSKRCHYVKLLSCGVVCYVATDNWKNHLIWLLWWLNEIEHKKFLVQCPKHSRSSIMLVSYNVSIIMEIIPK